MLERVTPDASALRPVPRPVASSLDELLAGVTDRKPMLHSDSKSGVGFERVVIDGVPHVLKHVHVDDDWTMRSFAETTCIPLEVWRTGMIDVMLGTPRELAEPGQHIPNPNDLMMKSNIVSFPAPPS